MAQITSFDRVTSDSAGKSRTSVACGYRTIDLSDGTKAVQLVTYGSEERKLTGKASQSIELDREHASALIAILQEAFPGL